MHEFVRIALQEGNEARYSKKAIDGMIREDLMSSPQIMEKVQYGASLLHKWMHGTYYASKMKRLTQLHELNLPDLVMDMFVGICYTLRPELFTSVSARLAGRLGWSDKPEAILTMAEMLAITAATDVYDITGVGSMASLMVVPRLQLEDKLVEYIEHSEYLPPMVCEPKTLTTNMDSGYLTFNDSLILGRGNHHNGDICLDALNIVNSVPLCLDLEFLSKHEEDSSDITMESMKKKALKKGKILTDAEAKERVSKALQNWEAFKLKSYEFYSLMAQQGNKFYFCHKVDKRGRIYSVGYHLSPQGNSFKKAMLEFADQETVTGVPPEYQL